MYAREVSGTTLTFGVSGKLIMNGLVMYDDEDHYPECIARLLAEGIDARRVDDEAAVSTLCSGQLVR